MKNKAIFFLCSLVLLSSCKKEQENRPMVQDIKELVFASGQIEWRNSYNLVAQTDGIIESLQLEVGDEVQAGQRVGNIQNPTSVENYQAAERQLTLTGQQASFIQQQMQENIIFAQKKYEQDKTQRERYQRLYEKQSVAKQELENMKLAEENSLSQLNALKEQLRATQTQSNQAITSAQNQRANNKIQASHNQLLIQQTGRVIAKSKFKNDFIRRGEVIATVANPNETEIVLNVDESSIGKITLGQPVFVRLNTQKDTVYHAKITEILAAFDQNSQSFICKAKFDDRGINPLYGTQLEANILVGEKKNALLIPRKLLGYGNTVRIKGKDEKVVVKTGIISSDYVEILAGIEKDAILLPIKP